MNESTPQTETIQLQVIKYWEAQQLAWALCDILEHDTTPIDENTSLRVQEDLYKEANETLARYGLVVVDSLTNYAGVEEEEESDGEDVFEQRNN